MSRRQRFEEQYLQHLNAIGADPRNHTLWKNQFAKMSDEQFDEMVMSIIRGDFILPVFSYNMEGKSIDANHVMSVGEKLGIKWFQRLRLTDPLTGEEYLTPEEFLVMPQSVRRQIQHLVKKRSMPPSTRVIDYLTGQVTGESKGASISLPELTALNAKGFEKSIIELIKVRGGDHKAYQAMMEQIKNTGGFSLAPILDANTRPKSLETLNELLAGMMFESTL